MDKYEVAEIRFHDDFETIGKEVTNFLKKCESENIGVKKITIEVGEVTQVETFELA